MASKEEKPKAVKKAVVKKKAVKKVAVKKSYTKEQKKGFVRAIIDDMCNNGKSTIQAIKDCKTIAPSTFYETLYDNEDISDSYARAKESVTDFLEEQKMIIATTILEGIEEKEGEDAIKGEWSEKRKYDNVQRAKLMIDAIDSRIRRAAFYKVKEQKEKDQTININFKEHLPK